MRNTYLIHILTCRHVYIIHKNESNYFALSLAYMVFSVNHSSLQNMTIECIRRKHSLEEQLNVYLRQT